MFPIVPLSAATAVALLLSACGKQEAVGDVPSGDELAKQADAASQAIRDEAAALAADEDAATPVVDASAMTSYTNSLRGFSILVPKDWQLDSEASTDNGNVYIASAAGAKLTVGWTENREDADIKAAEEAVEKAGDAMSGEYIKENEYRAMGSDAEGQKTAQRIFRKPDGTMVAATIDYPADQAEQFDPLSTQILDSLTLQ